MAYCNWCHLDSESDDVCVWCKRPFQRNVAYSGYTDTVGLLREETSDPSDRATAIVGAIVGAAFLAVVIYAAVNFGGSKGKGSTDPLSRVAETERTWSADRPSTMVMPATSAGPAPVMPPSPPRPLPSEAPRSRQAAPSSAAGSNTQRFTFPSVGAAQSARIDDETTTTGVYLERVKIGSTKQDDGTYSVSGMITLGNVSGMRAYDLQFWLVVGEKKVRLSGGGGDIGSGMHRDFHVHAVDVETSMVQADEAQVLVVAKTDAGVATDSLTIGS